MRHHVVGLIAAFLTFTFGIFAALWFLNDDYIRRESEKPQIAQPVREEKEFRVITPKDYWVDIYFKSIDERVRESELQSLRTPLPEGDVEVRVWKGFGVTTLRGFVLRKADGQWSATLLYTQYKQPTRSYPEESLPVPQFGWDAAWQRLVDAGILSLPDAEEIKCNAGWHDGYSYVVEINFDKTYRTYMYENPDGANCNEAKQMMNIGRIIDEEFGVQGFKLRQSSL